MVPREKTFKVGRGEREGSLGWVRFWSPPRGTTWRGQFGVTVRGWGSSRADVVLTAKQARTLAAELLRRADDVESR